MDELLAEIVSLLNELGCVAIKGSEYPQYPGIVWFDLHSTAYDLPEVAKFVRAWLAADHGGLIISFAAATHNSNILPGLYCVQVRQ